MKRRSWATAIMAVSLVLLAFGLRVYRLGAQSVWFDEGWSWYLARLPLDQMARITADDRSPFLYYTLLHGWIMLTGQTEFAMRYLSVCADVMTTALVIALASALGISGSRRSGRLSWLAGALYTVCPLAVWYAQETRMYALMATLCVASSYWLWRWLMQPRQTRRLVISAALLAMACYTHYYAIFLIPAQGLAVAYVMLFRHGISGRGEQSASVKFPSDHQERLLRLRYYPRWVVAMLGVGVVLLPWLIYARGGFAYDDGFVFPLNTISGRLWEWVTAFASGGLARAQPDGWVFIFGGAALFGVFSFALAHRWREGGFLLLLGSGALLAATIAVRVVYPYRSVYHFRYLIYVAPIASVLVAGVPDSHRWGIRGISSQALRILALVLIGILWLPALAAMYTDPSVARDDVRDAVKHVVEALQPGDLVIMSRDNYAVHYYLHTSYPTFVKDFIALPQGLHGLLETDTELVQELNARQVKRVRLFLWQDDVVDPQRFVESTLWANGYEMGELDLGQIRLPLYQLQTSPVEPLKLQPIRATFGNQLDLVAYWMRKSAYSGDWFYAVLSWQPSEKLNTNYKVFVQVWDSRGNVAFQDDHLPLNSLLPTSTWKPGALQRDAYAMVVPQHLPAGNYRVVAGVYDPATPMLRLSARSEQLPVVSNAVILGTLHVRNR